MGRHDERERWTALLRAVAEAGETTIPPGVVPWFQASRRRRDLPQTQPKSPDDQLWARLIARDHDLPPTEQPPNPEAPSPLFSFTDEDTIEVWTERDLSGMHALSRLLQRAPDPNWKRRLRAAVRWHLENTQPDNATGRPWAIHVFLERWIADDDHESRLYAETLLHNCQMQMGRADGLSAEILRDAADALSKHESHSD